MRTLYIEPCSEAEKYFVNELMFQTKDEVKVQLGINCNMYTITDDDFMRIRKYLKEGS